jgi:3-deoxy-D-manno-octulosonic-acid transferase
LGPLGHALAALAALGGLPLAAAALALRRGWRTGFPERLGLHPRGAPGPVWVHAASVGEILAAARLVDELREAGHAVVTSTVTLAGREVMRRARPDVPCHLAPLDHPWCAEIALARVRPAALVFVETELWPCWVAAARRRGVPTALVSGRLSDRSLPRYRRLAWIVRPTLERLAAIGARSDADAERFRALGARPESVSVTGDLKLEVDAEPPPVPADLDRVLGSLPLVVAGSTHPGEEAAVLAALAQVERAGLAAALVLAPRDRERAAEVARLVRRAGRALRRRTSPGSEALRPGEVLLLDTLGELPALWPRAEVAFVGGTLAGVGGHNVLEPVRAGRPVLFGPRTENVRHAAELAAATGAGLPVADAAGLGPALCALLRDPAAARERGERGRRALLAHRGSAARSAALVESVIDRGGGAERSAREGRAAGERNDCRPAPRRPAAREARAAGERREVGAEAERSATDRPRGP